MIGDRQTMGVKGLFNFIKSRSAGTSVVTNVSFNDSKFIGQTWGIDGSNFLYKFCYNSKEKKQNSHLDGFYKLFRSFYQAGIQPVLVLDGQAPPCKRHTIEKRKQLKENKINEVNCIKKQLTDSISMDADEDLKQGLLIQLKDVSKQIIDIPNNCYDEIYQLCKLMNVPIYRAKWEADALLAKLYKSGQIQAIVAEDSDMLLYGGGILMSKFSWRDGFECLNLDTILSTLQLNHEQFVQLCLMCGTDYTQHTISGIGPATAYDLLRSGQTLDTIVKTYDSKFDYKQVIEWLQTSAQKEDDIIINKSQINRIDVINDNLVQLNQLLVDKCNYRKTTVTGHWINFTPKQVTTEKIDQVDQTKLKLNLNLKLKPKLKLKLNIKSN